MNDAPKENQPLHTLPIVPGPITIDPSDPEVQWILSRTCLACAPIAHIFQRVGYPIPTHAEEEQTHVLLWMLARYQQHGKEWREKGDGEIKALRDSFLKTAYFTFGQSHAHSVNGKTFDKDCVVKITHPDPRAVMVEHFSDKWAMQYDAEPDMSYYPRGVMEL